MGWCHEFGPQVNASCDHPMVAGREACSCPECRTVCKGKFAGCVDVWARGPRAVQVLVRPSQEPLRRSRTGPTVDDVVPQKLVHVPPVPAEGPGPRRLDDHSVAVIEQLLDKVRMLESAVEAVAKAPRPAPAPVPAPDHARVEAVAKAVGGLAAGLDRLTAEVSELRKLPRRLDELERRKMPPPAATAGAPGADTRAVERLAADMARLSSRVGDLAAAQDKAAANDKQASSGLVETLTRLDRRVAELDQARTRLEAAQSSRPESTPEAGTGRAVAAVEKRLEQLAGQVAGLAAETQRPAPPESPVQQGRINAMEKVVSGLLRNMERLSAGVGALDEVPKRLDALESSDRSAPQGPPVEKVLVNMGKRLDRLSTQVGELKGLHERVQAIEEAPGRTDSLSKGLGGAIDMIDQLSAQVAAIEHAALGENGRKRASGG